MERLECPYCEYQYTEGSRIPMILDCGHTMCRSCIDELKLYFVTCPFDSEKANFKDPKINESVFNLIKRCCKVHYQKIIGYCSYHLHPLCGLCQTSNNSCKIIKGDLEELNNSLGEEYISSSLTIFNLQNTIIDVNLTELNELLINKFNSFNQIKKISIELDRSESDKDMKIEILRHVESDLTKSIEDLKSLNQSITDTLAKGQLFEDYLINCMMNNSNILMNEVKALRFNSNVLRYFNNFFVHQPIYANLAYIATFSQIYFEDWPCNCIGVGNCTVLNQKLRILNIELMVDGVSVWKAHDLEIIANDAALTSLLFTPTFNLKKYSELYIQIEIQDAERFVFYNPVKDDCVRLSIFNECQELPVAYIAYASN